MNPPLKSLLVVVALLVLGASAASVTSSDAGAARQGRVADRVPVTRAMAVCPDPREDADAYDVEVHAMTPKAHVPGQRDGVATVAQLLPDKDVDLTTLEGADRTASVAPENDDAPAVTVTGTQALAPGLAAESQSRIASGDMRGLASGACPRPGTDFWFVGGGSEVGQRTSVLLTNPALGPAQVDVSVYGEHGALDAPGGRGVVVGARQQQALRLDALAPGAEVTAVHVQVRTGQVAAAVFDTEVDGITARGTDWVPVTSDPAKHVVVPGLAEGDGVRRLHVFVPGQTDAVVQLEVITPERAFVPAGQEVVEAKAGEVTTVELSDVLEGEPAALRLRSDVPLVASGEIRSGGETGTSDVAYAAAVPPLDGPTAALGNRASGGGKTVVYLTAPRTAGVVTMRTVGEDGSVADRVVKVPTRTTVRVELKGSDGDGVVLTPRKGSGALYAARVIVDGEGASALLSVESLWTPRSFVEVPEVSSDLSTSLR